MITPEQFQEIGETLLPLLDDLTEWIARDMIERFMIRFGRGEEKLLTGTDEWQAWVLEQAGGNLDEIQKALAKSTGKSQQEIAKIFKDSGIQAAKADAEAAAMTFSGLSPGMMAIITDAYERTVGEITNITRTTAGTTNQAFIDICDAAYWKVRTGAQSYTAAMLEGVKELGQVQPIVRYPSGHKDTLEVAVLRCIRTGVAQSSGNMTIQQCKDMGWNHVLVSQHLGARVSDTDPVADHAGWQGKVYCIDGKDAQFDNLLDATGYPENPLGLCGYNCRHSFTPFLPGISQNHNKPIDTEANRRAYELSQTQRAMERRIRAQKRKCTALHTAVKNCEDPAAKAKLKEKYTQSAKRLQEQNAAYTKFCADNDLKPYHERLAVAGWDRSAASTASAAVRAQQKIADVQDPSKLVTKAIENSENGSMMKSIKVDDIKSAVSGGAIKEEVAERIYNVLDAHNATYLFDEAATKKLGNSIVFQTDPQKVGTFFDVVFVMNEDVLGVKTVDEISEMFKSAKNTVANNIEEAVVHEIYHAKLIQGLNYAQLENLYDELNDIHIEGLSKTAYIDGTECIAETGVLIERGEKEKIPKAALALFERFFGEI